MVHVTETFYFLRSTVPVYVFACIYVLVVAIMADRMRKRFIFVFVSLILCLIGLIINITPAPSGVKYFGLFLIVSRESADLLQPH